MKRFRDYIKSNRGTAIVVTLLLVFQFCTLIYLSKADSQTIDEGVHLSAGYTYLVKHDYRLNTEHPPLVKLLCALPLLKIHPSLNSISDLWDASSNFYYDSVRESYGIAERFLYDAPNNASLMLFWGRFSNIILTLLLGLSVFFISRRFWGNVGGLLSLTLFVFDPNVIGHGHLVTTDIGASIGYLLTIYCLYRYLNKRSWSNLLWLGLSLGVALAAKFTMLMLLPIGGLLILLKLTFDSQKFVVFLKVIGGAIAALFIAWLVIWSTYGYETKPAPVVDDYTTTILTLNNYPADWLPQSTKDSSNHLLSTARPLLIPREFFKGSFQVVSHVNGGHSSFLLGETSDKGWWYYFPVVFLFKTPIATLFLLALLAYLYFRRRGSGAVWFFGTAAVAYLLIAMMSKADLGIRHVLPIFPVLYVVVPYVLLSMKKIRLAVTIALVLLVAEVVFAFPYSNILFSVFGLGN